MKKSSLLAFLGFLSASVATGIIGSLFSVSEIPTWYMSLLKPPLNPPNWIFGPVWTTLYVLMAVAALLVWRVGVQTSSRAADVRTALWIFFVQLVLNTSWSVVFFGAHSPLGALFIIIAMAVAIYWTTVLFARLSWRAALLLVPYLCWVLFASYLNLGIWWLN